MVKVICLVKGEYAAKTCVRPAGGTDKAWEYIWGGGLCHGFPQSDRLQKHEYLAALTGSDLIRREIAGLLQGEKLVNINSIIWGGGWGHSSPTL